MRSIVEKPGGSTLSDLQLKVALAQEYTSIYAGAYRDSETARLL